MSQDRTADARPLTQYEQGCYRARTVLRQRPPGFDLKEWAGRIGNRPTISDHQDFHDGYADTVVSGWSDCR